MNAPLLWSIAGPVTPSASADASQAAVAAISSGSLIRRSGTSRFAISHASSAVRPGQSDRPSHAIDVLTQPGQIAFTWIARGASSAANARTSPSSPAFDAQYAV